MKVVLGMLLLANAALLLWGLGQREFAQDKYSPAKEFHPELMELLPAGKSQAMAKVTINTDGEVLTSTADQAENITDSSYSSPGSTDLATARQAADIALEALTEVDPGQCMLIGPYKSAAERGRNERQLEDMNLDFSENENPQGRVLGFRVYQGPFDTSTDVSRAKRRLEKQGVKDLYLIDEGPGSRFISLGFFSNEGSAKVFMHNFAEYKVKSKLRLEYATYYWIKISDIAAIKKLNGVSAIPLSSDISKIIKDCDESW